MKVLTYVDDILTVINGSQYFSSKYIKPSFISTTAFYYEPTLKVKDDRPLTQADIQNSLSYINSFDFGQFSSFLKDSAPNRVYAVDQYGNYLGNVFRETNTLEVESPPLSSIKFPFFDGNSFVESVLIDKDTKYYIGKGNQRSTDNTFYAPLEGMSPFFHLNLQRYSQSSWIISLKDAKSSAILSQKTKQSEYSASLIESNSVASLETASYLLQEKEANLVVNDSSLPTPFLDALLEGRGKRTETKLDLAQNILRKASRFKKLYAFSLGKFKTNIKLIESFSYVSDVEKFLKDN